MDNGQELTISGEYYLQGVREMASGFWLKPDLNFEFFFTYGALDRYGSGKWTVTDGKINLQSGKRPQYDFALLESRKGAGDMITVTVKDNNNLLPQYVHASLEGGKDGTWLHMSKEGIAIFPMQDLTTISLLFEFCPERFSTITIDHTDHSEFDFRFEPWIAEVFFENFNLKLDGKSLCGKHPLMEGAEFQYEKN